MIQLRSVLQIADNSGAKKIRVIQVHGGSKRRFGYVGDIVAASVIQADANGTIKKGEKVKAVIVRTRKETRRANGEYVRFDDNAAVIIESRKNNAPIGTRVFGPIAREVKDKGYSKIASLAPEVL
ncbi:MAG: 50S ribosomal protein L14 [Candidatus Pacebacteria bacterium]|nr:50S ribosomal protein L14 [Candidatus Paceibacterota bacterium]PIR64042.1 MAG: 50S ribosomal protein L14 [Candidatus Pacebacteria bacterium CG10_big_fil_rev_8_21_14_0_10_40_26]PIZ78146.1 MAG: 50S ribosomal protein L14 [Candidatus Pacebacteria bacterium CG_4_10_14_0_2_um_filter_40_20]PJA69118.1 MAG: 50S ribosomal protein L14 [Candidatus Pacebacteria bacterium CG_4_9_14_3_um_filter_40_12]PJC41749.1 MAG: 50S ribosomal protein L14 [Candidatus Pacebacteria bacterium CG_4_9_14_0_2_um_filter_40_15]